MELSLTKRAVGYHLAGRIAIIIAVIYPYAVIRWIHLEGKGGGVPSIAHRVLTNDLDIIGARRIVDV
jgi:hypothetical protein